MSKQTVTMPTARLREKTADLASLVEGLGDGVVDARRWRLDRIVVLAEAILAEVEQWMDQADGKGDG